MESGQGQCVAHENRLFRVEEQIAEVREIAIRLEARLDQTPMKDDLIGIHAELVAIRSRRGVPWRGIAAVITALALFATAAAAIWR